MTPGTYLALRRQASGWSRVDLEGCLGLPIGKLARVEAGDEDADDALLHELRGAIPFNPIIARGLRAGLPMQVCRGCGCSEYDPCETRCHWAQPGLCSECARGGVK